jgi:hypothetical protein
MALEEKRAWTMAIVSVVAYAIYVAIILGRSGDLADRPYAATLIWTVVGAIVANIVVNIGAGIGMRRADMRRDARDREILQFGDRIGQAFVVIGALSALLMALAEWGYFWIANAVYLCFVLSAILGSIAKIVAYRRGLPQW